MEINKIRFYDKDENNFLEQQLDYGLRPKCSICGEEMVESYDENNKKIFICYCQLKNLFLLRKN